MKQTPSVSRSIAHLSVLQPLVDSHITVERIRRYVASISSVASPSTAASFLRGPILRDLLQETNALETTACTSSELPEYREYRYICTQVAIKKLWYIAHLDTVSYLVQSKQQLRYALVPFCHHMIRHGKRSAIAYRFIPSNSRYEIVASGCLESEDFHPFFRPESGDLNLKPGDRIVFSTSYQEDRLTGNFTAHIDNAGAVAALLAAAPVLAAAKVEALLAFPDEEEGPPGAGNQMIGRGSARILNLVPLPDLVVVSTCSNPAMIVIRLHRRRCRWCETGEGAVLAEFSSLGRGRSLPASLRPRGRVYRRPARDRCQGADLQQFIYFAERRCQCDVKDSECPAFGICGVQSAL
jgi:hypothetical protein